MTRCLTRRVVPLCGLLTGLLAGQLPHVTSVAHAQPSPTRPRAVADEIVRQATSARLGNGSSLSDVAALSETDVWAVGQEGIWDVWQNRGVVTRWDGRAWTEVGARGDVTGVGPLRSISAVSATELWVVGDGHDGVPYIGKGGRGGFDRVIVPPVRGGDWLRAVAAQPGRVVTVGSRGGRSLIATGAGSWTATIGPAGALHGVALSGKDGWAVGDTGSRPLVMRLTGNGWKSVSVPAIKGGYLRDVYLQSAKRAVAVGGVFHGDEGIEPLILRWDGKRWTKDELPIAEAELYGVTGDGEGGYWASGHDPARPDEAFLFKFTGRRWEPLRGEPATSRRTVRLQAVTRIGDLTMAVGHVLDKANRYGDLVETFGPVAER
ncbi:hypothetical protein [Acrocarpospora macrocephala]|uniref:hypothetical protein n=1 Tax=Acrocarpospora macrocephala TaxID=150177 RepID=UPI0012D2BCB4|nr:hypothetical protein [Acrocarpospora macrocephala]